MSRVNVLEISGLSKKFGGTQALSKVDFNLRAGTIHAIVGENGAGKSTLGKIISGQITFESGEFVYLGEKVNFKNSVTALKQGISVVAQELAILPHRSVIDNIFLKIEPHKFQFVDKKVLRRNFLELCEKTGLTIDPDKLVGGLKLADQQKVEILRAVAQNSKVIVFDEPTSALTASDSDSLLSLMRKLADAGTSVIFVSHFLDEVIKVSDFITIMKDGKVVRTTMKDEESIPKIIAGMLGRDLTRVEYADTFKRISENPLLAVKKLHKNGILEACSFELYGGEILGITGLVGSGKTELARTIFGADQNDSGFIEISGVPIAKNNPHKSIKNLVVMIPEERKSQGLFMKRSIYENVVLAHLKSFEKIFMLSKKILVASATEVLVKFDVKIDSVHNSPNSLSGGNQQRLMFAKWFLKTPKILLADEPTRGVDVGAKAAIYTLLRKIAKQGVGVVVFSSDIDEVMTISDRILVMQQGKIIYETLRADTSKKEILDKIFDESEVIKK